MIPRNLWHMGAGLLRRAVQPPEPAALLHYPAVWRNRAGLKDCNFGATLVENAYFRHMELAIWFACGTQGILHACARNRWYFVFGSQGLRHYQDIGLFQPYEVHTRNIYWDDSWLFLLAQFRCPDDPSVVFAEGLTRVMLRQGRDRVDPRLLYAAMGFRDVQDKDAMPEVVEQFLRWDAVADQNMKATAADNAIRYAHRPRPGVLSSYSMNLPFWAPTATTSE